VIDVDALELRAHIPSPHHPLDVVVGASGIEDLKSGNPAALAAKVMGHPREIHGTTP
jgi:hypothetical protein